MLYDIAFLPIPKVTKICYKNNFNPQRLLTINNYNMVECFCQILYYFYLYIKLLIK